MKRVVSFEHIRNVSQNHGGEGEGDIESEGMKNRDEEVGFFIELVAHMQTDNEIARAKDNPAINFSFKLSSNRGYFESISSEGGQREREREEENRRFFSDKRGQAKSIYR